MFVGRIVVAIFVTLIAVASSAEDLSGFARVYVYREGRFVGSALNIDVLYDGAPLVKIPDGSYYAGLFSPGEHTFEVYDRKSGAKLNLEAGKSYFFRVEIVPGVFKGGARMTLIQPEQGSFEVTKLKEVDDTFIRHKTIRRVRPEDYWSRHTMAVMATIAQEMLGRHVRRGLVPKTLPREIGVTIGNPDLLDAWGTPLRYVPSSDRLSFLLVSAGSDAHFDEESWTNASADLVDETGDAVIRGTATAAEFVRQWRQMPR